MVAAPGTSARLHLCRASARTHTLTRMSARTRAHARTHSVAHVWRRRERCRSACCKQPCPARIAECTSLTLVRPFVSFSPSALMIVAPNPSHHPAAVAGQRTMHLHAEGSIASRCAALYLARSPCFYSVSSRVARRPCGRRGLRLALFPVGCLGAGLAVPPHPAPPPGACPKKSRGSRLAP